MHDALYSLAPLEELGAVRVRGADVVPFLQGQLSCDVGRLGERRALLAGYHNPQGRVLALPRLVALAPDDVLAIVPRELAAPVAQRLAKFILRSRVTVSDASAHWRMGGLIAPAQPGAHAAPSAALPTAVDAVASVADTRIVRLAGAPARWLLVGAQVSTAPLATHPVPAAAWRRCAIGAGEPQVYGPTSGVFLAQMLNLDLLGAVDFAKGCYTGQEVIARAHWRGRVKRRLQRFGSDTAPAPAPGTALRLADGRSARVVDAVAGDAGGCEFLAVVPLAAGVADEESESQDATAAIDAVPLPLPYALPGAGAPPAGGTA